MYVRIKVKLGRVRVTMFVVKKLHILSACLCMDRIILSSVTCLGLAHFSTLSHKLQDFRGKGVEQKICVLIFYTTFSSTLLILRRIERYIIINLHTFSCKVPVFLDIF
jgi:uncharacterized membrane protein